MSSMVDVCVCFHSELVALKLAVVFNLAEPEVVGGLGLVPSVSVECRCGAEVACDGSVEHKVDDETFGVKASCHFAFTM